MKTSKRTDSTLTEGDLAAERMGRNSLHGNDQANTRNQRKSVPDQREEPDDNVRDAFRKMDKDVRAEAELGKQPPGKR